ncbi:MAG TPA: response regulator transcription factor, partial [Syntrophorhabdaceae bacterium]|nr:response regulator transcription factor [Syntrophorhabdaceae bacterium]
NLRQSGFKTKEFTEAESFYRFLKSQKPDLIILDLMLPDVDGFEVCKYLRKEESFASIPVLMLTARTGETEKVLGLELGADDYVTKPFSPRELVARVKAILRRHDRGEPETKQIAVHGVLSMDIDKHEIEVEGKKVDLTPTEFGILELLATKQGRVHSREQILNFLWGEEKYVIDRTIDVHVRHLREKLGIAGGLIKSVRGLGYRIEE